MKSGDLLGGRFRLGERVGAGGMGVVFRARDETTARMVALKILEGRNPVEIERAGREIEILARLEHPAIVAHIANGVTPSGQLYLAMDWIDGCTVAERLTGDGFSVREAVAVIRQIADALVIAHAAGVLHRDIKPTNVLLPNNEPAAATLIDFGIARVADVKSLTRTGTAIGTPGYMSPEQARGERTLTPATDVFGLGCLLYECLTGRPAFSGTIAAAVIAKLLFAYPPPIRELCPDAPTALVAIAERMLAKDPVARYAGCDEVRDALDALGAIPDGPRRNARHLVLEPTAVQSVGHCMVLAARGQLDEQLDPPTSEQVAVLSDIAKEWRAKLEVFSTGAVGAHLSGAHADATHRAASCALAMRTALPGWSISVSTPSPNAAAAAESGSVLLSKVVLSDLFRGGAKHVAVEPGAKSLLDDDFELDLSRPDEPRLVGARKRRA